MVPYNTIKTKNGALSILRRSLQLYDIGSLRTAGTFNDVEFHLLVFVKGLEAFALDSGKMYEYIIAVRTRDKTKTLIRIEPFDFAVHEKPPKDFIGGDIIARQVYFSNIKQKNIRNF